MTLSDFSLLWTTAQASPDFVVVKSPDPEGFIAGLHLIAAKSVGLEELESIALRELRAAWRDRSLELELESPHTGSSREIDRAFIIRITPILEEL